MEVINSKKIEKLINYIKEDKNFLIQKKSLKNTLIFATILI